MRLYAYTLVFALIAAFHTVIATQANAESALFRVKQSWSAPDFGPTWSYLSPDYHPRTMGPSKAPPATGLLITFPSYATPGFSVPNKVIKSYGTRTCFPFGCNSSVTNSSVMHSYWNAGGTFGPGVGPSSSQSIMFETTMRFSACDPRTGEPVSPTTLFNGNYDFSRSQILWIRPGPNRFGGTLRMLAGANQLTIKTGLRGYPYDNHPYRQYGADTRPFGTTLGNHNIQAAYRYKMTYSGYNRITTGTPYSPGDYYIQKVMYLHSDNIYHPSHSWTTGTISTLWAAMNNGRCYATSITVAAGYDNRTSMGLNGNISLVRPRLVHSYVVPHDPNEPIRKERTFVRIDRITVHFLPEPGGMTLLATGLMGLLGLYLYRRD